ncbi:FbpB family small basic protein [Virgibacillus sp. C22-A2]|uniref:FbpB family small basic protein n=1 Tax=Virgibacillus tibetensis TaxID=3042313 RepID=A0ABU6KCM8_9BACI|nr:FbpB family small basic protein [Virgibacillus sp. C22-A2]
MTFDDLVQENRQQIMKDHLLMEKIEQNLEMKMHQSLKQKKVK